MDKRFQCIDDDQWISVKELRNAIEHLKDDDCIYFGCADLTFQRIKKRGDGLYQIEFDQIYTVIE